MANVVHLRKEERDYPIADIEEPARPYRLWNAKAREQVRWRYYSCPKNAHLAALIEARWGDVGTTIEVFDSRTAALLGQYRRTPTSVAFFDVRKLSQTEM